MKESIPEVGTVVLFGNPRLRQKAVPVTRFDAALRRRAESMVALMHARNGVGLATEQVGPASPASAADIAALCVIDVPEDAREGCIVPDAPFPPMPLIMVNPRITESSGSATAQEGCLSFPEIYAPVKRAAIVTVEFQDLDGHTQSVRGAGLLARAIQHEVDHLNGVLLIDRMSTVKRISLAGALKKLRVQSQEQAA
jgi:peptide deformylase